MRLLGFRESSGSAGLGSKDSFRNGAFWLGFLGFWGRVQVERFKVWTMVPLRVPLNKGSMGIL